MPENNEILEADAACEKCGVLLFLAGGTWYEWKNRKLELEDHAGELCPEGGVHFADKTKVKKGRVDWDAVLKIWSGE